MKPPRESPARAIWAIAWRSVVYLPLMLCISVFLLLHLSGLFILPVLGGVYLWLGLWSYGLVLLTAWLLLLWSWRRFRLYEHFQDTRFVR